ncbi:hypothetical protein [Arthrobacter sp. 754]|uniref:hypothetical protein n=1 Tax=Arthrobacter sp. 754 TaxID=3156315 RepID=UPI003399D9EC
MTTPDQRIAVLPDSPETRLLVALTSHASDLSEAAHTLRHAFEAGEGSELWLPLTSHAVTAYIRPFIDSSVRTRLDKMPEIPALPPTLAGVHEKIRKYRNTTVAHSQSRLTLPLPVAFLDAEGRGVKVSGISIIHPMPLAIAESFSDLISVMEDLVDQATQPVLKSLRVWLQGKAPDTIKSWDHPEFIHATDSDFSAASTRTAAPRFTAYWHVEP